MASLARRLPHAAPLPGRAALALASTALLALAARAAGALLPHAAAMLVAETLAIALPGLAVAHIAGLRARLDTVAVLGLLPVLGIAAWIVPFALALLVHVPFVTVVVVVLAGSALLLSLPRGPALPAPRRDLAVAGAAALVVAFLGARWQASFFGDAVFHTARIRRILALDGLSVDGLSTYFQGAPHAGYAFPLLHAVQAAAIWLSGLDASVGYASLVAALALWLPLGVFAAGRALAGPAAGLAAAILVVWAATPSVQPQLSLLAQPGAFTFLVLFPCAILALAELARDPDDRLRQGLVVTAAAVILLVHPTYVVAYLGMVTAVLVFTRRGLVPLLVSAVIAGAVAAALWWVALGGARAPRAQTGPWRKPTHAAYVFFDGHPVTFTSATIAGKELGFVVALAALLPLLLLARRRHALPAAIMAGSLALVALPPLALVLNASIGIGQAHRMAWAIPWAYVAGTAAALLAARLRRLAVLVAVAALAVELVFAGLQAPLFHRHALPTTLVALAAVAVACAFVLRGVRVPAGPAIVAPLLPTALLALAMAGPTWDAVRHDAKVVQHGKGQASVAPAERVPEPLADFLRSQDDGSPLPVVLASPLLDYQLAGSAALYPVATPEVRSRAEPRNHPGARRAAVETFLAPATPPAERRAILRRYHVTLVVLGPLAVDVAAQLRRDPTLELVWKRRIAPGGRLFQVFRVAPAASAA